MPVITFEVPQGSVLGPYLFILYTNCIRKLVVELDGECVVYVDDTTILVKGVSSDEVQAKMTRILVELQDFFSSLNLCLNWEKTVAMLFNSKKEDINLNHAVIKSVDSHNFLGISVNRKLSWKGHIENIIKKINRGLFVLKQPLKQFHIAPINSSTLLLFILT